METQRTLNEGSSRPRGGTIVARPAGGRYESIRAQAKRRRFVANAIVVSTTGAVLARAAVFDILLAR